MRNVKIMLNRYNILFKYFLFGVVILVMCLYIII